MPGTMDDREGGLRGSGISVLIAGHDDDDDDDDINVLLTFMCYLIAKPFLYKKSRNSI